MIPPHARIVLATQPIDFRKGPDGLAALVRDAGADPFSGALYVFRAKRADRVKIIWWDGINVIEARSRKQRGDRRPCLAAGFGSQNSGGLRRPKSPRDGSRLPPSDR